MNKKLSLFILSILITSTVLQDCDDFIEDKQTLCQSLEKNDGDTMCTLVDNNCKSVKIYTECESYTGGIRSECEAIKPSDYNNFYCFLDGNTCKKKLYKCTDFTTSSQCRNIIDTSSSPAITHRCIYLDNNCKEHKDDCEDIEDETECNSNIPPTNTKKCEWKGPTDKCKEVDRTCNDYISGISADCILLKPNGDNICINDPINGRCIDSSWDCESESEKACNSRLSVDEDNKIVKYNYECKPENSLCKPKQKSCTQYIPEYSSLLNCEIDFIVSEENSKKSCVLINNNCIEEYKTCEAYNAVTNKDSGTCKNIKLADYRQKCDYISDQCKTVNRKCSELNEVEILKDKCEVIKPSFSRCVYSNGNCDKQKKTCLELASASRVTKSVCEDAITSDSKTKKCEIKSDNFGCQEVDIPHDTPTPNNSNSNDNTETGNQSGGNNINSKIIFAFFYLLFL